SLQSNVERFAPSQTCTLPLSTEQNACSLSSGAHFESAWHAGFAVLHTRPSFAQTVVTIKFSSHADATPLSHFAGSPLQPIDEQRANGSIWRHSTVNGHVLGKSELAQLNTRPRWHSTTCAPARCSSRQRNMAPQSFAASSIESRNVCSGVRFSKTVHATCEKSIAAPAIASATRISRGPFRAISGRRYNFFS